MCKESKKKRLHLYLAKEADPPSKFQEKKERKKKTQVDMKGTKAVVQ